MCSKELEFYFDALFKRAQIYEWWRRLVLSVVLILLSVSLYASGKLLYGLAAGAVVFQLLALLLDLKSKGARALANDFQKYSMLIDAFKGAVDTEELLGMLRSTYRAAAASRNLLGTQRYFLKTA